MLTPPRPINLDPKLSFDSDQFIQWDTNTCLARLPLGDWGNVTALSLNIIERYPALCDSDDAYQLLSEALLQLSKKSDQEALRSYGKAVNTYLNTEAVKRYFKAVFVLKWNAVHLQETVDEQMKIDDLKATLLMTLKISQKFDNELRKLQ